MNRRLLQSHLNFNYNLLYSKNTSDSNWISEFNELHESFYTIDSFFLNTDDIHILFSILTGKKLLSIIQKIKQLATINLVEWNPNWQISKLGLQILC